MDEHEDLIRRLRDLGRQPIDPAVHSAHLAAMERRPTRLLSSKLRVAGAFLAGLLVGGSGLAVAGALPDPAQNVAHRVFEQVGVEVPQPERYHGEECGPEQRNHGQYVKANKALAETDCGKPLGIGEDADDAGEDAGERGAKAPGEKGSHKADRGPCEGPPPWATDKSMTPEQKAAAQAEREVACPDDEADEAEDAEQAPAATPEQPTTTTTAAPATTTTLEEPTTTTTA